MFWRFLHLTLAASCIHCLVTSTIQSDEVIVKAPVGSIRGRRRVDKITDKNTIGTGIDTVDVFMGIPYAEPPTGDLRFTPPKPKASWDGTRNATATPAACPQTGSDTIFTESEDCLYLNVYSPFQSTSSSAPYPVMVYIHGGSYIIGTANEFSGHILARHGVVVVIINYRLGVLGFLTTGDDDLPGNYGLQDQTLALKWVSKNIRAFRGDPKQVTIFGSSAGGSSVGIHLLSPSSAGLFHRAIIQSGPITNTLWAHHTATPAMLRNYTISVAKLAKCTQTSIGDIIKCLRKLTWKQIQDLKLPQLYGTPESLIPVVDGKVIPGRVEDLLKEGKINKASVIIGMTKDECVELLPFLVAPELRKGFDVNQGFDETQFKKSLEYALVERYGMPNNTHFLDDARFEYTDHKRSSTVDKKLSNRYQLVQLCTDVQITSPTIALADALVAHGLPTYLYVFDHPVTLADQPESYVVKRSFHQIELPFVFGAPYFRTTDPFFPSKMNFTEYDKTITLYMTTFWTDFTKTGNPSPPKQGNFPSWPRYDSKMSEYLYISSGFDVRSFYKSHRVAFWNDYVPYLTNKTTKFTKTAPSISKPRTLEIELIAVSAICALLCIVVVVLSILMHKQRRKAQWKVQKLHQGEHQGTLNLAMKMPEGTTNGIY